MVCEVDGGGGEVRIWYGEESEWVFVGEFGGDVGGDKEVGEGR